jgi:hypothetical protein
VQPILLVPTKPPLSAAVMAELIGQQASPFASTGGPFAGGQLAGDQKSVDSRTSIDLGSLPVL